MEREVSHQLTAWKNAKNRKPLVLMGARQVGKTTSLQHFGASQYDNIVYLNFEDSPHLKQLFAAALNPYSIIQALEIETHQKIIAGKTLMIFDEVQECPAALNSLKYFNEDANQYHLCAAGSLLGVKLTHQKGFPVGKVNFLDMHPLCFCEFLDAIGEANLKKYIESLDSIQPLAGNLHEKLLNYLWLYLYIGGMPEAVAEYAADRDLSKVREIQLEILRAYALDFSKHAPNNQIMKINQVWSNIPNQLAKENKKFIYSVIRKGARAKEFEVALQWLDEAGLIHKVYNISAPKIPLKAYANFEFFKVYLVDVGLLGAMTNLSAKIVLQGNKFFQEFRGSFVENYVAQELARCHKELYYWSSEGKAEVDFVFQHEGVNFPLEVKSGKATKKKSLKIYADKYSPDLLIRASTMNLKQDDHFLNCPLYLLSKLQKFLDSR
ncbi:MAG: DUF4143 domain-containing protein [Gammaproteobacteria bacterium]|jgi:predicted AAA+ superfamily ATPase